MFPHLPHGLFILVILWFVAKIIFAAWVIGSVVIGLIKNPNRYADVEYFEAKAKDPRGRIRRTASKIYWSFQTTQEGRLYEWPGDVITKVLGPGTLRACCATRQGEPHLSYCLLHLSR